MFLSTTQLKGLAMSLSIDRTMNPSCTSSSSIYLSAHDVVQSTNHTRTESTSGLEQEIEASKVHWSQLSTTSCDSQDGGGESNREIYERLRRLPRYQHWLNVGSGPAPWMLYPGIQRAICSQDDELHCLADVLLHDADILHGDLQASNVLCSDHYGGTIAVQVADYESSIGVVGTGFWRAPEILQQLKEGKRRVHFTCEADVYSYAMTCYEILTGCVPFEGSAVGVYEHVLSGERSALPDYVPAWVNPQVPKPKVDISLKTSIISDRNFLCASKLPHLVEQSSFFLLI